MKYLITGGGTAGHINPAIAIAATIKEKEKDAQILFVGNEGGMESTLVPQAGFDFKTIKIRGFKRSFSPKAIASNIKTVSLIFTSSIQSKKIIKEFKPDVCIGTGGYVSGPVVRAAEKQNIPTAIHEQNAFPGVTTKMLSKKAKAVMLAISDAQKHLSELDNVFVTGNPVRKELVLAKKEESRKNLKLDNRKMVLSFGGSLGARKINEAMAGLIARSGKDKKYQHIHAYGKYGKWFPLLIKEKGCNISEAKNLDIREYINNMPDCMAAADLIICRAGAITISELQVQGKAAILVPSPNVAENHQYHNAMALVSANAAEIIEEKDLTEENLMKMVDSMLSNEEKLKEYSNNAKKMAIENANEKIYKIIKDILA